MIRLTRVMAVLALLLAGCGDDDMPAATSGGSTTTGAEPRLTGTLTVFAASSLTEAFSELGQTFEEDHPGLKVTFNFAASSALAQQINEGGAADILVTADESNMKKVADDGNVADAKVIARNRLSILVERGNPKAIRGLTDLAKAGVVTVLCAPEVPCGKLAAAALAKAAVTLKPASLEENVKGVVSKITLGEADAGIVYVTDVKAAGEKVEGVAIDLADDPSLEAVYPMAMTSKAGNIDAATAWLDFVLSDDGLATLASYGFLAP